MRDKYYFLTLATLMLVFGAIMITCVVTSAQESANSCNQNCIRVHTPSGTFNCKLGKR